MSIQARQPHPRKPSWHWNPSGLKAGNHSHSYRRTIANRGSGRQKPLEQDSDDPNQRCLWFDKSHHWDVPWCYAGRSFHGWWRTDRLVPNLFRLQWWSSSYMAANRPADRFSMVFDGLWRSNGESGKKRTPPRTKIQPISNLYFLKSNLHCSIEKIDRREPKKISKISIGFTWLFKDYHEFHGTHQTSRSLPRQPIVSPIGREELLYAFSPWWPQAPRLPSAWSFLSAPAYTTPRKAKPARASCGLAGGQRETVNDLSTGRATLVHQRLCVPDSMLSIREWESGLHRA